MYPLIRPMAAVLLLLNLPPAVQAEDITLVAPVIVTATRTAQTIDETLASVVVIDRATIEQTQALDTADLLRLHAGLDVARNGGPGQTTSVFIRGAESNHTLVMIDGVKINSGTIGAAAVQNISPDLIERIEIVKGPRSTLYGSEAIGGVINIITRRAVSGTAFNASLGAGNQGTRKIKGGIHHAGTTLRGGVEVQRNTSDGFPALRGSPLDRGYENNSINAYLGAKLSGVDIEASHWQTQGTSEYQDSFTLDPLAQDFTNRASALTLKANPSAAWATQAKLSQIVDIIDQNQVNPFSGANDFSHTKRNVFDWQNDVQISSGQLLTAGLTLSRENTESLSYGTGFDKDTDVNSLYVQDDLTLGAHQLLVAVRGTDHETAGFHTTWNMGYGYQATPDTRLIANVGTAFRSPDAFDRFGYGGNLNLKPETSRTLELGIRHNIRANHSIAITAFHNRMQDLISYNDPDGFFGPIPGANENIESATIRGIETSYRLALAQWRFQLEGVLQNAKNRSTGAPLARRASRSLTASTVYDVGRHQIGLDLLASGPRKDSDFSSDINNGYSLLNLTAQTRLGQHWTVRGKIENLLNKEYTLVTGYNTQGRLVLVSVEYSLGQ